MCFCSLTPLLDQDTPVDFLCRYLMVDCAVREFRIDGGRGRVWGHDGVAFSAASDIAIALLAVRLRCVKSYVVSIVDGADRGKIGSES